MSSSSENGFEIWDAGGSYSYLYTEHWQFAKELKKEFGRGAVYCRNTHAIAWQFKIPKRVVEILKARFRQMRATEKEIAGKSVVEN
jgi:hypothetical protein